MTKSAAGVERVLGDAASGQAAESRWFTITPERAGLQVQLKGQAPRRLPGGSGRAALPHAASDAVAGEHSDLAKTLFSGHSAPGRQNFLR